MIVAGVPGATGADPGQISAWLGAAALASARLGGLLYAFAPFNSLGLESNLLRGGIILALAVPVFPLAAQAVEGLTTALVLALLAKELFLGVALGLVFSTPFWLATAAGDMIASQQGALVSDIVDPGSGEQTTALGTLLLLAMTTAFVALGPMAVFLGAVYESYQVWPPGRLLPLPDLSRATAFGGVLAVVLQAGLVIAAPLVLLMLAVDLILATTARVAPKIDPAVLGPAAKSALLVLLLPIYLVVVAEMFDGHLAGVGRILDALRAAL